MWIKRKTNASYFCKTHTQVYLKHNMILYEKAHACPCHFVGKELKDSDLQKYSHRTIVDTKAMSSAELIEQLTKLLEAFAET